MKKISNYIIYYEINYLKYDFFDNNKVINKNSFKIFDFKTIFEKKVKYN
jgi:hypothetical protein